MLGIVSSGLRAQSLEPYNPYSSVSPSAETYSMTKFGGLSPSLYTGAMTYSVPIFTYSDPDFTLPISLEYNFDGFRPSQHSGTIGYGWHLECGGAITREVRGLADDDVYYGPADRPQYGYWWSVQDGFSSVSDTFDADAYWGTFSNSMNSATPTPEMSRKINPFSHIPTQVEVQMQNGTLVSLGNSSYDMVPDIYHFSFLGHHGDFMLMSDGTFRVFNSDLPSGEVDIEFIPPTGIRFPGYINTPGFVITLGDGMRYTFGGSVAGIEYSSSYNTASQSTSSLSGSATAFRLVRIEAPNGRYVNLNYSYYKQSSHRPELYYSLAYSDGFTQASQQYQAYNSVYFSVLESISVGTRQVVSFNYTTKTSDENASTWFDSANAEAPMVPTGIYKASNSLMLTGISVTNEDDDTVENAVITHSFASSGTPKMFLNSVTTMRGGKHSFDYNVSGVFFPHNDTRSTDHWGWWNGQQAQDIRNIVTFSGSRYNQISGSSKNPSFSYSSAGALTKITYPTGGTTSIEYEGNSAAECLDEEGVIYTPNSGSFAVGGVRVKKLSDKESVNATAKETSYTYADGFLFHMPRYCMQVSIPYICLITGNTSSISFTATAYNSDSNYSVCRDGIIGYGTVTSTSPDGSKTVTQFSSYSGSTADSYQESGTYDLITKRGVISHKDMIDCGSESSGGVYVAMPVSDRKNMRGMPLTVSVYHADNSLRKKTEYTYSSDVVGLNWIYYNNLDSFVRTSWECRSPLLSAETVKDYTSDGSYRTTVHSLERNTSGQVTKETFSSSNCPGDVIRLYRRYYHESGETGASTCLKGAIHSIARTRTSGGTEYLTGGEKYAYSSPSVHIKPSSVTYYAFNTPSTVSSSSSALNAITQGMATVTSFQYNTSTYYLTRIDRPGGDWTTCTWSGTHLVSRTDNNSGNVTSYTWKDLVGLSSVTYPSGMSETYQYDSNNRLYRILDPDGNPVTQYQYNLAANQTGVTGLTSTQSFILQTTFMSSGAASSVKDVTYYDGLGYPNQRNSMGASPLGRSIITPIVYDNMGRGDATSYLPYTISSASGTYISSPFSAQASFHSSLNQDSRAYSMKEYETSSLGRPLSFQKEGTEWNSGGGHKITMSYRGYSVSNDNIMKFSYLPGSSPRAVYSSSNQYSNGDLMVTTTIDEKGDLVSVFTDSWGRDVCVRNVNGSVKSDTYNVYDLRDSLVLVIQPEGAATLAGRSNKTITLVDNASNANNDIYKDFCFSWNYDGWGGMIENHTPGCGLEEYAYDARGREVLMTNSLMSPSGTTTYRLRYTVYDGCDRVTAVRYVNSTSKLSALRSLTRGSASSTLPTTVTNKFTTLCTALTREYFPFSTFTYPNSGALVFVADANVVAATDVNKTKVKGMLKSETVYPAPDADGTAPSSSSPTLSRGYHYDSKGRTIQVIESFSDNHSVRYSTKYNFAGNVMASKETHYGAVSTYITTTYTRDSRGRTLSVARNVGGTTMASLTYGYDELGRLTSKSVGSSASESLAYDIHNWMTSISASISGSPVFSETLRYASALKETSAARFDGNISEIRVIHNGVSDDTYAYQYDALKRLTGANRYIGTATTYSDTRTEKYMSYDRNGNLTALKRYGDTGLENNLTFTRSGNRMTGLSDAGSPGGTFTFSYDALGNLTNDGRKGLVFSYNVLNLPGGVVTTASGSLTYTYLSDGTKVSAIKSDGSGERYIGSFVYSVPASGSETLESAAWDEGRINFTKSGSTYTKTDLWFVKDHVGNVRTVMNVTTSLSSPQVLERNDYLPFGTRMDAGTAVLTTNRFRLGGKENQTFGSLDLGKVDFGARFYDPFTAGWTTADPLAAKYQSLSPFAFCDNNPINIIDAQGDSLLLDIYGGILRAEGGNNHVYYQNGNELVFIGELGGKIDVSYIFNNLLEKNIHYAENMHNPMTLVNLVKPGGPWDYKNRIGTIWGRANYTRNTEFSFNGTVMSPDDIGNFHFGAVSKASGMIPEELGLIGAGIVQILSGTTRKEFVNVRFLPFPICGGGLIQVKRPYGDDPRDQEQILKGYEFYKNKR